MAIITMTVKEWVTEELILCRILINMHFQITTKSKYNIELISEYSDIINKLRLQNSKLRQKLKELNFALDTALDKAQKSIAQQKKLNNQLPPNLEQILKTKDREIANMQVQIQNYKSEITSLRQRVDAEVVGVDKHMRYETQLREAEKRNGELMREIKAL